MYSLKDLFIAICASIICLKCTFGQSTPSPAAVCKDLLVGQYICDQPKIDPVTQEISGCNNQSIAKVDCYPLNDIVCDNKKFNGSIVGFQKETACRYTNGYSYATALGLSLFLGWLGIDRFYLGYPAVGLLKFCTFGLCGIGALADFLLIALQVVLPSDGSNYVIDFYGPRLIQLLLNNETYYKQSPG